MMAEHATEHLQKYSRNDFVRFNLCYIHQPTSWKAHLPKTYADCFKVGFLILTETVLILSLDISKQRMKYKLNYYLK